MGGNVSTAATNLVDGTIKTGLAINKQQNDQKRVEQEDIRRNEREKKLMDSVFSRNPAQTTSNPTMATKKIKPDGIKRSRKNFGYPDDPKYGTVSILEFMCTVWSRLSYMENTGFKNAYKQIFKNENIINTSDIQNTNPSQTTTIEEMMGKVATNPKYLKSFIPFLPLSQYVNRLLGEDALVERTGLLSDDRSTESKNCNPIINDPDDERDAELKENDPNAILPPRQETLLFTSIATSNYSQCYVLADTRMPNVIGVVFRGTYSAKSAASFLLPKYMKLSTILAKNNIQVSAGVYKIMIEMVHTIINTIEDVKAQLQQKTNTTGDIKVIVTGHSLGGGLATLFSYVYMKTTTIQKNKLCCVSIGAARVLNPAAAKDFCNMCTTDKLFEYIRLTNYRDPVVNMPYPPMSGYAHPCDDSNQQVNNTLIYKECVAQAKNSASTRCLPLRNTMTSDYNIALDCTNTKKTSWLGAVFKSPLGYHAMYLGMLFTSVAKLFSLAMSLNQKSVEINRYGTDTACKLCFFDGKYFKVSYFNLTHFRVQNGLFNEDVHVTKENYAIIKSKSKTGVNGTEYDDIKPEFNTIESSLPLDTPVPDAPIVQEVVVEPVAEVAPAELLTEAKEDSTVDEAAPGAEAAPIVDEASPVVDEAAPTGDEAAPIVDEAAPIVAEVAPVVAEAAPVVAEATPIVDEAAPVVAESSPLVAEATPTEPVVDEAAPTGDEAPGDEAKNDSMVGGGVSFPVKDVKEPFLLKEKTNKQILPVPDPSEPTPEEIATIQKTGETEVKKGGKRTKRRKPKSRKKLYL